MKVIILIITLSFIIHKDLNFYGLLKINEFDKEIFVGMEINEFPTRIENYSFNDDIKSYAKTYFKRNCKEIIEINWEGKKYPVYFLLSEKEKNKLKSCKKHLYLTFQKTRKFGKLTIFLTGISKYSE
jgi:hypothetical protein